MWIVFCRELTHCRRYKEDYPLKIIVSCIDSLLYYFASFIQDIEHNIPKHFSYIKIVIN